MWQVDSRFMYITGMIAFCILYAFFIESYFEILQNKLNELENIKQRAQQNGVVLQNIDISTLPRHQRSAPFIYALIQRQADAARTYISSSLASATNTSPISTHPVRPQRTARSRR